MEECNQTALGPVGGEDGVIGQGLRVGGGVDPCLKVEEGDPLVHVDDGGDFSVNVLFTIHLLAGDDCDRVPCEGDELWRVLGEVQLGHGDKQHLLQQVVQPHALQDLDHLKHVLLFLRDLLCLDKDSDNFGRSQRFLIIYFPEDKCLHVRCGHGNLLQKQTQMQEKAECEVRSLESRVEEIVERGTWQ